MHLINRKADNIKTTVGWYFRFNSNSNQKILLINNTSIMSASLKLKQRSWTDARVTLDRHRLR